MIQIMISHYHDVIMGAMASQITSLTLVYSTVYSGTDKSKHQSSASLAFVWGIHRRPVNSPHKWPVTRKMFPFDDVIMSNLCGRSMCSAFETTIQVSILLLEKYTDHEKVQHYNSVKQQRVNSAHFYVKQIPFMQTIYYIDEVFQQFRYPFRTI